MVLAFSFSGSSIPARNGTLIDLGGECSTLSGFVFSGADGVEITAELASGVTPDPTVSIVSPADGSSFDDVTSIDVEVSCTDCGDGDHYHAYLDDAMQGMFYTDNFSINVGFGDHTLTVAVADGDHQEYENASASASFSVSETSAGGCDDPSACNDGDPDNDCIYADENYDCDGNCTVDVDCAGECGGSAVVDECEVCGGDGSACGTSFVDILYNSDTDIYCFQFNVDGVEAISASGGAAAAEGFIVEGRFPELSLNSNLIFDTNPTAPVVVFPRVRIGAAFLTLRPVESKRTISFALEENEREPAPTR